MIMLQTKSISSGLLPWKQIYVRGCKFAIFKDGKLPCVIQLERLGENIYSVLDGERMSCQEKSGSITGARMLCFLGIYKSDYYREDII